MVFWFFYFHKTRKERTKSIRSNDFGMHLTLASLSRLHGEGEFITVVLKMVTQGTSPTGNSKSVTEKLAASQIFVD